MELRAEFLWHVLSQSCIKQSVLAEEFTHRYDPLKLRLFILFAKLMMQDATAGPIA
jgi:hypothetical protein